MSIKNTIRFMIISALAFALMNVFVKYFQHFDVYQVIFFRSAGTLLFTIPLIFKNKIPILGNNKTLLVGRGVIGFVAMTLFFMSLEHLSLGSAVSIRYTAPIFGTIFAFVFLKEKMKWKQWLYFGIALIGVFILKEFDSQVNSTGLLYIILSAIFTGLVYIIIRKIGSKDHPIVVVNYFMVISATISGLLMLNNWRTPQGVEWLLLLALGVFGYAGQYYMTKALQSTQINQVAPLKYIEVIFTILIGVVWFSEPYSMISLLGMFLIMLGLVLNILINLKPVK